MGREKISSSLSKELLLKKIKENYLSLILGILVLITGVSLIIKIIGLPKTKSVSSIKKSVPISPEISKKEKKEEKIIYQVKEGDTLWTIAEKYFGSGFNALDIAKANNLKNPDLIEKGEKIIIPSVSLKTPTAGMIAEVKTEKVTLNQQKYTVQEGDYLWKIALEAYGDGYQWIKIAQANNLIDPNLIRPGDILILPR